MAHKTLIGGTAYKISGGKTLINGTAYSIAKGKTLINGTAYSVSFAPPDPIISIVINPGTNSTELVLTSGQVTINDIKYSATSNNTTLTVATGTIVYCRCAALTSKNSTIVPKGAIYVNGAVVAEAVGELTGASKIVNAAYDYVVTTNATIELTGGFVDSDRGSYTNVIITEY